MRPLEILIPALLAIYFLALLVTRRPHPIAIKLIPPLALLVNLAQILFEGYRWQMIPLYGMTAVTAALNLPSLFRPDSAREPARGWRTAASILTLVLLAVSTALPALLPIPHIANPSGPFDVGTQTFVLTDESRRELYSGREEPRKFMIQVWHPAEPRLQDARAPWMENADIVAPAIARHLELPHFFLDHLSLAKAPAYINSPLPTTEETYPIILFSHGWSGFAAQNSEQMIELASHGYVVVSMQHTYGAVVTVFPDGEIAYNNPDALHEDAPEPDYTEAARLLVDQWAGDMSFALNFMAAQNTDAASLFHNALDLSRVGVFGHSTGGGAAIQFCATDPRCIAGLAQDAFMTPLAQSTLDEGVSQPFLFMFSQAWRDLTDSANNRLFNGFYPHVANPIGVVTILDTKHYDFTDLPLLSPLAPQMGLKGPINGRRVVRILSDYLVAYFGQTLKGIPSPIPYASSEAYPDQRWEK